MQLAPPAGGTRAPSGGSNNRGSHQLPAAPSLGHFFGLSAPPWKQLAKISAESVVPKIFMATFRPKVSAEIVSRDRFGRPLDNMAEKVSKELSPLCTTHLRDRSCSDLPSCVEPTPPLPASRPSLAFLSESEENGELPTVELSFSDRSRMTQTPKFGLFQVPKVILLPQPAIFLSIYLDFVPLCGMERLGCYLFCLECKSELLSPNHSFPPCLLAYRLANQIPELKLLLHSVEWVFGEVAPPHWHCLGQNENNNQTRLARLLNGPGSIFSSVI